MSEARPTRPEVPITLDCERTLKVDFNAIQACKGATGLGFLRTVSAFDAYVASLAKVYRRGVEQPERPATPEEILEIEPPAEVIRGLLYSLLQHQWLGEKPIAPRLTLEQVGALIDFDNLAPVCIKIQQALAGNLPQKKEEDDPHREGVNGQSPLSPRTEITTGTPSQPSPEPS